MTAPTKNPNIFNYATSELSQDAFICYMLNFPNAAKLFLQKCGIYDEEIKDIKRQYSADIVDGNGKKHQGHIDILVKTDRYGLIIEDKTETDEHDYQICRYIKAIKKDLDYKDKEIFVAFVKRDYLSEQERIDLKKQLKEETPEKCLHFLTLKDLLECIKSIKDPILVQWYEKFKKEDETQEKAKQGLENNLIYDANNKRIFLDKLTIEIKSKTDFIDAHWFIAVHGTPHITLKETASKEIIPQKCWTSLSVYLMFNSNQKIRLIFKQHFYDKNGNRIKIKDYTKDDPSKIKEELGRLRSNIQEFKTRKGLNDWEIITPNNNKERLMIAEKTLNGERELIEEIRDERQNIKSIFDCF